MDVVYIADRVGPLLEFGWFSNRKSLNPLSLLTLCFCSSVRTSLRTLAHGMSSGHHMGLQLSFPQPGFPRPVEYLSISGMKARSWACGGTGDTRRADIRGGAIINCSGELHSPPNTHTDRRALEQAGSRRCVLIGRWDGHRPQIETGLLKGRRMRLCLLTEGSIAAAPAWRVRDTLGTGGFGGASLTRGLKHTLAAGIKAKSDAGRPLQSYHQTQT